MAKDTIAPPELAPQIGFEMALLIAQHDLLEQQIAQAEERVAGLLDGELARRLQTIPGVGPAICATLIAEIGDIHRFTDFDKLVAYVGVHPAEESSGEKGGPETSWRMAKTGNAYLRSALLSDERRRAAAQPDDHGPMSACTDWAGVPTDHHVCGSTLARGPSLSDAADESISDNSPLFGRPRVVCNDELVEAAEVNERAAAVSTY